MKTLKEFEVDKIDLQDVSGGKGGSGPTMNTSENETMLLTHVGPDGPMIFKWISVEFDEAIQ